MVAPHTPPSMVNDRLAEAKHAARRHALAARAACDPAWGAAMAAHVLRLLAPPAGAVVSAFWPMPGEIDTRPLLHALHQRGHCVLLPQTPPRGNPLIFRQWEPGMALLRERFGTERPTGPVGIPQVLFVPLVAFDARGYRLGYGGGYYDRTLAGLPGARAIGVAFAAQQLDTVPVADYDARLDAVATEQGVLRFRDF